MYLHRSIICLFLLILALINCQSQSSQKQKQNVQCWINRNCNFQTFQSELLNLQDKNDKQRLQHNLNKRQIITIQKHLKLKKQFEQRELQKNQKSYKQTQIKSSKRLLQSSNNQYKNINQGNFYQVYDKNYIYSHRWPKLYIHKIQGSNLTLILQKNISNQNSYVNQLLVSNNYLAILRQTYVPNTLITFVLIQIYHFNGTDLHYIRGFNKSGYLLGASQYNSQMLVIIQQNMVNDTNYTYQWSLSNGQHIKPLLYNGQSANYNNNYLSNTARSIAKISLDNTIKYQFVTYLFCDYANYYILSNTLKIYITGTYYDINNSVAVTSVQRIFFKENIGQKFGQKSKFAQLRGTLLFQSQMHQFNGYFNILLSYFNSQYTKQSIQLTIIPAQQFTTNNTYIYKQLQILGDSLKGYRFYRDFVFILFQSGKIKIFSISLAITTGIFISPHNIAPNSLWIYGNKYIIGFGRGQNGMSIIILQIKYNKLIYIQSIVLKSTLFSLYTRFSFYDKDLLLFDYKNKRITFPITYQNKVDNQYQYIRGYIQLYIDPQNKCLSTLPIQEKCQSPQYQNIDIIDKIFKHYNNNNDTQQILRSALIVQGEKQILVTASEKQIQARILKDPTQEPVMLPATTDEASAINLD